MIKNYMKIVLRNTLKYKSYSLINIAGLGVGIACALFILLWVQDELSYDRYHKNADRIYRLVDVRQRPDHVVRYPSSPFGVTPLLQVEFKEQVTPVRFFRYSTVTPLISYQNKRFFESRFLFADPTVFDIFSFPLQAGDPETALKRPNSVVITREMANKYFGESDPIGKILRYENQVDFQVTGIIQVPENSHFHFDFLASLLDIESVFRAVGTPVDWLQSLYWNPCHTYVLLSEDLSQTEFDARLPGLVEKHYSDRMKSSQSFYTQPLVDIHLRSDVGEEIEPQGDILYVNIFSAIAVFIILLACINFMNLSMSRSVIRAKEVGLRKVLGAVRRQLAWQFLGEAFLFSILALFLALALVEAFLPSFGSITGKTLEIHYFQNWQILLALVAITVFVGFVSGSYPALLLSKLQPATALRTTSGITIDRHITLRKALVVFQFTISIILIVGTIIISNQLSFLQNKKLGFDKEQLLAVSLRGTQLRENPNVLKSELLKVAGVEGVTVASDYPGSLINVYPFFADETGKSDRQDLPAFFADHDFLAVMGIELIEGRGISPELGSDSTGAFILNQAAVKKFGWDTAVGKRFRFGSDRQGRVVGVVNDFHYLSLHERVMPAVIHVWPFWYEYLLIKVHPENMVRTLSGIESLWREVTNNRPFQFSFVDETLDQLYR
ncbi:MAG: ABC transporter permease, partial [Calditrichaeota bacterium]|nr:ABC transporter permease [Calditrichota bacterium]